MEDTPNFARDLAALRETRRANSRQLRSVSENSADQRTDSDDDAAGLDRRQVLQHKPGTPDVVLGSSLPESNADAHSASGPSTPASRLSGIKTFLSRNHSHTRAKSSAMPNRSNLRFPKLPKLVMPTARRASMTMLDQDVASVSSLSPVVEPSNDIAEDCIPRETSKTTSHPRPVYVAPRHVWSTAQASADAASIDLPTRSSSVEAWTPSSLETLPYPVLNDRHSPTGSFSSVPSFSWSLNESENSVLAQPANSLPSYVRLALEACARSLRWKRASTQSQRADIVTTPTHSTLRIWLPHLWKVGLLLLVFVIATTILGISLRTLPLHMPTHLAQLSLVEVRDICTSLQHYSRSSSQAMWHVWVVLSVFFLWKQAFCIPGSLITNIVFGAMYGSYVGALWIGLLTSIGGMGCYLLAMPFGAVVDSVPGVSKALHSMRQALTTSQPSASSWNDAQASHSALSRSSARHSHSNRRSMRQDLWTYLLFLRLLPIVPYSMMNIACGILRVPLAPYAITLGVGSMPWNFCTAQLGEILQDVVAAIQEEQTNRASSNAMAASMLDTNTAAMNGPSSFLASGMLSVLLHRIWTVDMMIKLVLLSAVSMLPIVLHRYFAKNHSNTQDQYQLSSATGSTSRYSE
ncbi:hypothetical protein MYAM1_002873 [Malassezia yamatoensis]|uniref:VTT domain-containing protein n=1 Tax=Malassezia yamatoensis TaxID=253288 RepID=A0AAJ5YUS5_9BASI|nr:hypothetical protein MYAM1_002873 [Malassezia yamatoensis]